MRFLRYNYKFMKMGALLPLEKDASRLLKICFYIFRSINVFLISWNLIITIFYYLYVDRSIDQFLLVINDMLFIGAIIRLALYYTNDKKILDIFVTVNTIFKYSSTTGLEEVNIKSYVYWANFIFLTWGTSSFLAGNLFMAFPIFMGKEPIPLWYPYNSTVSPYFEISHIFQFLSQNALCFNYNIVDIFYTNVVVITAGQFTVLGFYLAWELENICFSALVSCGFERKRILQFKKTLPMSKQISEDVFSDIYDFMLTNEYMRQLITNIISTVHHHRDLLDFCEKLEHLLSKWLLLIVLSTLSHCVLILYGTSLSTTTAHRLQMAVYFIPALVQSFLMAFPSDLLMQQSKTLQFALYSTPWYLCHKELGSIFKFWHFRLERNFGLTLGKFTAFDLHTYSWVMKTSFSYFTVLRQRNGQISSRRL